MSNALTREQWEELCAGIFQVIHIMNLETSYQHSGVIEVEPILGPILAKIFGELRQEIDRLQQTICHLMKMKSCGCERRCDDETLNPVTGSSMSPKIGDAIG